MFEISSIRRFYSLHCCVPCRRNDIHTHFPSVRFLHLLYMVAQISPSKMQQVYNITRICYTISIGIDSFFFSILVWWHARDTTTHTQLYSLHCCSTSSQCIRMAEEDVEMCSPTENTISTRSKHMKTIDCRQTSDICQLWTRRTLGWHAVRQNSCSIYDIFMWLCECARVGCSFFYYYQLCYRCIYIHMSNEKLHTTSYYECHQQF